ARTLAVDVEEKESNVVTVFRGFVETLLADKNDFEMPMIISTQQASDSIRKQLAANKTYIYFPARFTSILRFISLLPYSWQARLTAKLVS
ncbi:short-chain dehydrogenase, partial [Vibrio parahaemolyticus]|nr:short-chain dehydrogenase [Vibrio parahaemolyticus]